MSIYFVYRSPFMVPTTKFVKKIEVTSILDFFQTIWPDKKEEETTIYQRFLKAFGSPFYGLSHLTNGLSDPEETLEYIYPEFEAEDFAQLDLDIFYKGTDCWAELSAAEGNDVHDYACYWNTSSHPILMIN